MKKIKLLAPIFGLTAAIAPIATVTSCGEQTKFEYTAGDEHFEKAEVSNIEIDKEFTITCTFKEGYALGEFMVIVGNKTLVSDNYTVDGNNIIVKKDVVKSKHVALYAKSKLGKVEKSLDFGTLTFGQDQVKGYYQQNFKSIKGQVCKFIINVSDQYPIVGHRDGLVITSDLALGNFFDSVSVKVNGTELEKGVNYNCFDVTLPEFNESILAFLTDVPAGSKLEIEIQIRDVKFDNATVLLAYIGG